MKNVYYAILKFTTIALAVCCTLTSCQMGRIEIKRYRDRPKDPALIGEWLYLGVFDEIKSNPDFVENNRNDVNFLAGIVYHSNGDLQVIRLHYYKDSSEPRLVREAPNHAFYTKDGVIYYIETHPKRGDYPNCTEETYIIKGNLLCTDPIDGQWKPQYERKTVTVDLFPSRVVE